MNKERHYEIEHIRIRFVLGSSIHNCIPHAIIAAFENKAKVIFEFNTKTITIDPKEIHDLIAKQYYV